MCSTIIWRPQYIHRHLGIISRVNLLRPVKFKIVTVADGHRAYRLHRKMERKVCFAKAAMPPSQILYFHALPMPSDNLHTAWCSCTCHDKLFEILRRQTTYLHPCWYPQKEAPFSKGPGAHVECTGREAKEAISACLFAGLFALRNRKRSMAHKALWYSMRNFLSPYNTVTTIQHTDRLTHLTCTDVIAPIC